MPQPDANALRDFTRHCHDAFFRAILSDSERANALIHAHWPKTLRWMLAGEPARPIDPSLVHVNLRQTRADKVYLVGGTPDQPIAVAPIEHTSSPGPGTPEQVIAGQRGLRGLYKGRAKPWAVPLVFSTRGLSWNVSGAIDETGSATDILRQLTWAGMYVARVTRKISYEALSPEPVSRAMVGMMNIACLTPYPVDELRRIWSTDLARRRIDLETLAYVLSYALATSDIVKETLCDLALDAGLEVREINMDLITQPLILDALAEGVAKGKAEGKAEGEAKGRAEGRADLLLHLFRQRFGSIPEGVEVKVRAAQPPDLEAWADALFDARKLDDVFQNGGAR